jgi:hypothetical protein
MMTEQDIYIIAKAWIEKDHEDSAVDWVKLMANDLSRRFEYEKSQLKNHGGIGDVSERVQRIAAYFAKKNPTPTKWANDILEYILEGSKHDR